VWGCREASQAAGTSGSAAWIDYTAAAPTDGALARDEALDNACFDSEDYKEGRRAFAEKRKPLFRGR